MNTYQPTVSPRAEKWIRFSAIAMMLLVAVAAVVLSFDGLRTLAVDNRVPDHLAFLFPIIIDGTITMSSLAILRMNLGGQKATFGWLVMFFGVGLSIAGNAISVRDSGIIAMLVHALPPILLAISLELLLSLIRANIKASRQQYELDQEGTVAVEEVTESGDVAAELAPVSPPMVPGAAQEPHDVVMSRARNAPLSATVSAPNPDKEVREVAVPDRRDDDGQDGAVGQGAEDDVVVFNTPQDTDSVSPLVVEETVIVPESATEDAEPEVGVTDGDRMGENDDLEERVARYRRLVEGRDEWNRAKKITVILAKHPDAVVNDIKRALGDKMNVSYKDDMATAKKYLKKIEERRVNA